MNIYDRAKKYGCQYETCCVSSTAEELERLMKGATRANKKQVARIAQQAGIIDTKQAATEIKKRYFNPYNHYKTKTHIIYVHSGIEHFIRVNDLNTY